MKETHIKEIRAFNRFYTDIIGLLDEHVLDSSYSLPEVRVMYELYHQKIITASDIISIFHIDKSYLSRILRHFENKKLIIKKRSKEDGRSVYISLTVQGRKEFELLNETSSKQIKQLLKDLSAPDCELLIKNMNEIKNILLKKKS
jgi:DNA-binding MarR family transcriptional regulator